MAGAPFDDTINRFRNVSVTILCLLGLPLLAIANHEVAYAQENLDHFRQQKSQGGADLTGTVVTVIQAGLRCFSDPVRVGGHLVPKDEAILRLDLDGYTVAEVLAHEGDIVTEGQRLVRIIRSTTEPSTNPVSALPQTFFLRAPAAGKIIKSNASIGTAASPRGVPLFHIAADNEIEVAAEVPSLLIDAISPDQSAIVKINTELNLKGRVRQVAADVNPSTQMGEVRLSLDGAENFEIGRFVNVEIEARKSCGLSIPESAVLYGEDGTSVQAVRGHVIETLPVKLGLTSGSNTEIVQGLQKDDIIVSNAGTSLRDGDHVRAVFLDDTVSPENNKPGLR